MGSTSACFSLTFRLFMNMSHMLRIKLDLSVISRNLIRRIYQILLALVVLSCLLDNPSTLRATTRCFMIQVTECYLKTSMSHKMHFFVLLTHLLFALAIRYNSVIFS